MQIIMDGDPLKGVHVGFYLIFGYQMLATSVEDRDGSGCALPVEGQQFSNWQHREPPLALATLPAVRDWSPAGVSSLGERLVWIHACILQQCSYSQLWQAEH